VELAELQAQHDAAAEAIGAFEAEYAVVETEWKAKRVAVNDAYRKADAALQSALGGPAICASCGSQSGGENFCKNCGAVQPAAQAIEADGVVAEVTAGEVS